MSHISLFLRETQYNFFTHHLIHLNAMVVHQDQTHLPTQVFKEISAHPAEQQSFAHLQEMHTLAIMMRINNLDSPGNENIVQLQEIGAYPSSSTVDRWMVLYNTYGHARAFQRSGNRRAEREIHGRDLILLAVYRAALPKATIAELNAFLFSMNQGDPEN